MPEPTLPDGAPRRLGRGARLLLAALALAMALQTLVTLVEALMLPRWLATTGSLGLLAVAPLAGYLAWRRPRG